MSCGFSKIGPTQGFAGYPSDRAVQLLHMVNHTLGERSVNGFVEPLLKRHLAWLSLP